MNNYKDIINLTRPQSKHPHLGIDSRAAQFAPFAALTGYDSAVKETARLTKRKIELNDELKRSGGHIGYSIRPTERRKGYNKYNLSSPFNDLLI